MTDLEKLLAEVTPGEWEEITPEGGIWPPRVFSGSTIVSMVDNSDMTHREKVANARLIAMAPTLARKVIAAERLANALRITRDRLSDACHSEFDGVWTAEDFERETSEADEALAEWEALK